MSRYDPINLALIPPPASVQVLDFDTTYAAMQADFVVAAASYNVGYNVTTLRSDPAGWVLRAASYRVMYKRAEINDAINAVLVPTATAGDLDNVCADFNIVRRVLVPADPTQSPPAPAVLESDDALRARRILAPEALSSAGPGGAYRFFAIEASADVRDAAIYGPEDGQVGDTFVQPGQVLICILSASGAGGLVPEATLLEVAQFLCVWDCPDIPAYLRPSRAQLDNNAIRPDTDHIILRAVQVQNFLVTGLLSVAPGASASVVQAEATAAIQAYCAAQNVVGGKVTLNSLIAAGRLLAPDGTSPALDFTLTSPLADIVPGPLGTPHLTGINILVNVVDGSAGHG